MPESKGLIGAELLQELLACVSSRDCTNRKAREKTTNEELEQRHLPEEPVSESEDTEKPVDIYRAQVSGMFITCGTVTCEIPVLLLLLKSELMPTKGGSQAWLKQSLR